MMQILKEYYSPFVLERTKLTKIVDTVREQFMDQFGEEPRQRFEVTFKNGLREPFDDLEKLLATENSARRKIIRFLLQWAAPEGSRVDIDFMGYSSDPNKQRTKVVSVRVDSDNTGWRDRALADIEAQLERTWQRVLTPGVSMIAILAVSLVLILSQLTLSPLQLSNQMATYCSQVKSGEFITPWGFPPPQPTALPSLLKIPV